MDLLTTILACSLYIADDGLVRAIAESNPQSNPYFVLDASVDLTQLDPPTPAKTLGEAIAQAEDVTAKGGRPVLGLMQLPPAWLSAFGRQLADAFDPCTNLAIGTAMLSQFDYECAVELARTIRSRTPYRRSSNSSAVQRRPCILRKYEEGIGTHDFITITTLELKYQHPAAAAVTDTPIFAPPSARTWGPNQIIVRSITPTSLPP